MPTLIVTFHCMCLFVPDEKNKAMHVLMPAIHGPGGGGMQHGGGRAAAAGAAPHVVRMVHRSFTTEPQGRSMDGLGLALDGTGGVDLTLNSGSTKGPVVPDLTDLTSLEVNPDLVTSKTPKGVAARMTFRAGRATEKSSDPFHYALGSAPDILIANTVTWVIPGVKNELTWDLLDASATPPISKLSELDPEVGDIYKIHVHHETPQTLPGGGGPLLTVREMQQHFGMYYALLGTTAPSPGSVAGKRLLPQRLGAMGGGGGVQCESAMARLK